MGSTYRNQRWYPCPCTITKPYPDPPMPTVPKQTKCAYLGCTNERSPLNTYCLEHGGKGFNDTIKRKQFNAKYQTAQWSRTRMRTLSLNPLCEACRCAGKITQATEVDHLFAWQLIGEEAFFHNVFQSLCKNCHTVKGSLERKGIFRHYANQEAQDYGIGDYARVCHAHATEARLPAL